MTSIELAARLARRTNAGLIAEMSAAEKADVLEAMNAAIYRLYSVLPPYYRRITEGFLVPAPVSITLGVTNGSFALTSGVFTESQFGRTVVVDGDGSYNAVAGGTLLDSPYMGATGTRNCTIYGDALVSDRWPFDKLSDDPQLVDGSSSFRLFPMKPQPEESRRIGRPSRYWVEHKGNTQGVEVMATVRLDPMPDRAYTLKLTADFWPVRLTYASFETAVSITVPDQFLDTVLVPFALDALTDTSSWGDRRTVAAVNASAERAESTARLAPTSLSIPSNRIGTPRGF